MAERVVAVNMRIDVDEATTALAGILAAWNNADPDGYRRLGTGSVFPELAAAIERAATAMDGAKVRAHTASATPAIPGAVQPGDQLITGTTARTVGDA